MWVDANGFWILINTYASSRLDTKHIMKTVIELD